jgi:hypothetical protein
LTNTSAAGVPVSLSWVKMVPGSFPTILPPELVIAKVKSESDGTFNFTSEIDTTYFVRRYFLSLTVGSNKEYIILGHPGVTISANTYFFDQNAFQGVQFEVYKKANLKIRLHRTQNDDFTKFSISHSIFDYWFLYDYNVGSPQEVIDQNKSELNVETVADVYTKIKVVKTFLNGTSTTTIDSVRCTTNATTTYDVIF